jgi:5-formyltetrahydrofolate cyclo-ligase
MASDLKRALRAEMSERRARLDPEEALRLGRAAQENLLASPHWLEAESVALYMPIRQELATGLLLERARAEGKRLLLPRCLAGERGKMELVPCRGMEDLAPGAFGIPEPLCGRAADPEAGPDLLVVPALALDAKGYRLGYGGGFYDRLPAGNAARGSLSIGLIYSFQFVPELPVDPWDQPVRGVCTEKELRIICG